jgi:predicted permease
MDILPLLKASTFLFLWPVGVVLVGMLLGQVLLTLTKTTNDEPFLGLRESVRAAVMFGNASTWPILLFKTVGPGLLRDGVITSSPNNYLPIYLVLDPLLKWAVGAHIFGLNETPDNEQKSQNESALEAGHQTMSERVRMKVNRRATLPPVWGLNLASGADGEGRRCATLHSLNLARRGASLPDLNLATQADVGPLTENPSTPQTVFSSQVYASCNIKGCLNKIYVVMKNALVPPVIGTLLGLLASQTLFYMGLHGNARGQHENITRQVWHAIWMALKMVGACTVPVNLLLMGGTLAKGVQWHKVPMATNIGTMLTKTLFVPCFCTMIVWGFIRVLPPAPSAAWLVALVVPVCPTANQISVMVEVSGRDKGSVGTIIATQLLTAPVTLSCWLTIIPMLLQQEWFLPTEKRIG